MSTTSAVALIVASLLASHCTIAGAQAVEIEDYSTLITFTLRGQFGGQARSESQPDVNLGFGAGSAVRLEFRLHRNVAVAATVGFLSHVFHLPAGTSSIGSNRVFTVDVGVAGLLLYPVSETAELYVSPALGMVGAFDDGGFTYGIGDPGILIAGLAGVRWFLSPRWNVLVEGGVIQRRLFGEGSRARFTQASFSIGVGTAL